jgi:hypothetical protein
LTAWLAVTLSAFASPVTFDQANQAFADENYSQSARDFDRLIALEGFSVPLLFNAGNAWFKAGEPGRAILNYERAQMLAPRDKAVAHNLKYVREQTGLPPHPTGALQAAARRLSWNTLTALAGIAGGVLCGVFLAKRIWPRLSRLAVRLMLAGSATALLLFTGALALRASDLNRAIVLTANAPARIAPAEAGGISFELAAGQAVQTKQQHGDFVLVQTADGRSGWINTKLVAKVMASHPAMVQAQHEPGIVSTGPRDVTSESR